MNLLLFRFINLLLILLALPGCYLSNLWIGRDLDIICKSHRSAYSKIQESPNLDLSILSMNYWKSMENGVKSKYGKELLDALSTADPLKRYELISEFAKSNSKVFDCLEIRELYIYLDQLQKKKSEDNN